MKSHRRTQAVLYAAMIFAAALFMLPYYWLGSTSLQTEQRIFTPPPGLIPAASAEEGSVTFVPEISNFADVFRKTNFGRAFLNSGLIAVGHVSLSLFLCSLAGFAFAKHQHAPGRDLLFQTVLGTMLIPAAVTTIPVFIVMARLGLMNTYWSMILPGAASAFGIFWMRQYINANVPDELLDAARIDGCSEFEIYARIVIPVIRPALGALGVLSLLSTWNNLLWAILMLRSEDMYTLPILIYMLQGEQKTDYGMVMASGLLASLPLLIAFLLFQRSFVAGITAGAVKE
jgi:ABC-type glycerol-3-phosphate transport system permease component